MNLNYMRLLLYMCTTYIVPCTLHLVLARALCTYMYTFIDTVQEQVTALIERKDQLKEELGSAQEQLQHWKEKYRYRDCT